MGFNIIEVNVTVLNFNPKRWPSSPKLQLNNFCTKSLQDLKEDQKIQRAKKNQISFDDYKQYKWYNSVLRSELDVAGDSYKLRVIHWEIESGNEDAFYINGEMCNNITIITGLDTEYWHCSEPNIYINHYHGSRSRIHNQYRNNLTDILERRKKILRPEPTDSLFELVNIVNQYQSCVMPHNVDLIDVNNNIKHNTSIICNGIYTESITTTKRTATTGTNNKYFDEINNGRYECIENFINNKEFMKTSKYQQENNFDKNQIWKNGKVFHRVLQFMIEKVKKRLLITIQEEDD